MNKVTCYTKNEMAMMLGVSEKSVRNRISNLKLTRYKSFGPNGIALYTVEQFDIIRGNKKEHEVIYNYTPIDYSVQPVIITYYIYESKMNNHG